MHAHTFSTANLLLPCLGFTQSRHDCYCVVQFCPSSFACQSRTSFSLSCSVLRPRHLLVSCASSSLAPTSGIALSMPSRYRHPRFSLYFSWLKKQSRLPPVHPDATAQSPHSSPHASTFDQSSVRLPPQAGCDYTQAPDG
ncbi:hypothetical protein EI94DRAFT_1736096 [Lactarius quietus]|nr:hypothetical protein EI94DRAFT_1736096 [Lactarius quietus]